jgi:hypothetical protein
LAEELLVESAVRYLAHYRAARRARVWHQCFGGASILLSAAVAAVLLNGKPGPGDWRYWLYPALSMLAAVASGFLTFWHLDADAEAHRKASVQYDGLRKDIQLFIRLEQYQQEDAELTLQALAKQFKPLADGCPEVSGEILRLAEDDVRRQGIDVITFREGVETFEEGPAVGRDAHPHGTGREVSLDSLARKVVAQRRQR